MERKEFMKDILCDTARAVVMALSQRSKQNEFECTMRRLYKDFARRICTPTTGRANAQKHWGLIAAQQTMRPSRFGDRRSRVLLDSLGEGA
jgi:hypothetical protein